MLPKLATVLFVLLILWLFKLDRTAKDRTSNALWIPIMWLLIAGSRNVGQWLEMSSPMDQGARYLEGNPLDRAVLTTLMVFGVIVLLKRPRQVGAVLRASVPLLLYFAYCGLSSLWSDYPDVAFKRWFRGLGDIVMVLLILTDPDWILALKRVLTRVSFLLLPLSVLLIRYYPNLGRGYSNSSGAMFWTGVTTDKNGLGMICLIFGLGNLWYFIEIYQRREGARWTKPLIAHGIVFLITLWLLWESNSMTSISCFGWAVVLMVATGRWPRARKPAVVSLLATTAIAFSAFALFSGGGGGLLQALGRNPTLTGRTEVWKAILPFTQNPIVGSGYESFWLGDRLVKIGEVIDSPGINEAHNGYLEIYLNLGWMGLTLLALAVAAGYRRVILAVRQNPAIGNLWLAYFVLALIYNFTEAAFKMQSPVWIFFLMAMMAPPIAAVSESPTVLGVEPTAKFLAAKPRGGYALGTRSRQGIN
jgi:exopolysaccharide production protein ExoQ